MHKTKDQWTSPLHEMETEKFMQIVILVAEAAMHDCSIY